LVEHVHYSPGPDNVTRVETVVEYLQALNSYFELGLLGCQVRIFEVEGTAMQRMQSGFDFFMKWCEDAFTEGNLKFSIFKYIKSMNT